MARFQRGDEIRDVVRDDGRAYCEEQLALLADGWRRIRAEDELELPDDPRDDGLERALRENPDDDQLWLVYADLYIERNHPRGQIMAIESAPVKNVVHRAEREAQTEQLREAARDVLVGPLQRRGLALKWRRGFVYAATLRGQYELGEAEDALWSLLRHPSARFLRELVLDVGHRDGQDHRLLVALVQHVAPPLRQLAIEYESLEWVGFPPLGPLGAIGGALPLLEDLVISSDDTLDLRGLSLPRAKRFKVQTIGLRPATLAHLRAAPWPNLEDFAVTLGNCTCTPADFGFVFDGSLSRLRKLTLTSAPFANEIVEAFVGSPIVRQLHLLDLSQGRLDDRVVEMLVAARASFAGEFRIRAAVDGEQRQALLDANLFADRWWW